MCERSIADVSLAQSIAMSQTAIGSQLPFAGGGTATSERWLTRSENVFTIFPFLKILR